MRRNEKQNKSREQWQTLILWALLAKGGSCYAKDLRPEVKRPEREALVKTGLITADKGPRQAFRLEVTDKGWAWAANNLGADLPESKTAAAVLQAWLRRLQVFMAAKDVSLAEVIAPPSPKRKETGASSAEPDYASLREQIRKVYLEVTGGSFNKRALLCHIRDRLKSVDRQALDEALKRMERENAASLMQLDNRVDVTEADRAASIQIGREPRHILWITQ